MTSNESAVYNRISTKCHAYVKYYFPDIYKKLVSSAEAEYKNRQSRRNSLENIQKALEIKSEGFSEDSIT
jgi:cation transport regulator ChaB